MPGILEEEFYVRIQRFLTCPTNKWLFKIMTISYLLKICALFFFISKIIFDYGIWMKSIWQIKGKLVTKINFLSHFSLKKTKINFIIFFYSLTTNWFFCNGKSKFKKNPNARIYMYKYCEYDMNVITVPDFLKMHKWKYILIIYSNSEYLNFMHCFL